MGTPLPCLPGSSGPSWPLHFLQLCLQAKELQDSSGGRTQRRWRWLFLQKNKKQTKLKSLSAKGPGKARKKEEAGKKETGKEEQLKATKSKNSKTKNGIFFKKGNKSKRMNQKKPG